MDSSLQNKENSLRSILQSYDSVAVAFSGGVDSSLLLEMAHEVLGEKALALTAAMAALPARELHSARDFCQTRDIHHIVVPFDEFAIAGFAENPRNRCYLCKYALLNSLLAIAEEQGITVLAEGSNLDDEDDYRPGKAAVEELGVISPFLAAGFSKDDIRALSKERGLASWDKAACACLASRLPFGTPLSEELFRIIDEAEQCILDAGAKQVRVRVHDDLARIELDEQSIALFLEPPLREHIDAELKRLGFARVTLDLHGYRMGSMNAL